MISGLKGTITGKNIESIVIDVNNVYYEVLMSSGSLGHTPAIGESIEIWTKLIPSDDAITLYGFLTVEDRQLFNLLLTVNGVGPRVALNVLGSAPLETIVACISEDKPEMFPKVRRLGPKTIKRIILELKSKISDAFPKTGIDGLPQAATVAKDDIALQALVELGYSVGEAEAALSKTDSEDPSQRVKDALQNLSSSKTSVTK